MNDDYNSRLADEAAYFGQQEDDRRNFEEEVRDRQEDLAILIATQRIEPSALGGMSIQEYWELLLTDGVRADYRRWAQEAIELLLDRSRG